MLGSRWDLLEKAAKKAAASWPKWAKFKVQIEAREWQSLCIRSSDALILCPQEDLHREPTVVQVRPDKAAFAKEGVRMRCNDPACTSRSRDTGLTASGEDQADVAEEDKVDLLAAMLEEDADAGEAYGNAPDGSEGTNE